MSDLPEIRSHYYPDSNNPNRHLRILVRAGLHYIRGNQQPRFSLTCDRQARYAGGTWHDLGGGANHDLILRLWPDLKDLAALHLSDMDGKPLHAESNGWYWLAGSLGGLGERYHGGNTMPSRTPGECLDIFMDYCRLTAEEAKKITREVREVYAPTRSNESARITWKRLLEGLIPRWKAEADAAIKKYGLTVYGDPWPPEQAQGEAK